MVNQDPSRAEVFGFYRLDGRPVVVRPGQGPEFHDGQRVDRTEWANRAVRISRNEYFALVRGLYTPTRARSRRAGLEIPTQAPSARRSSRRAQ